MMRYFNTVQERDYHNGNTAQWSIVDPKQLHRVSDKERLEASDHWLHKGSIIGDRTKDNQRWNNYNP